jgi:hypothetical protein
MRWAQHVDAFGEHALQLASQCMIQHFASKRSSRYELSLDKTYRLNSVTVAPSSGVADGLEDFQLWRQ